MKKILSTIFILFLISGTLAAKDVPVKIIENNPGQYTHFFDINATLDIRGGIMMGDLYDSTQKSLQAVGSNIALGFSYRWKPKFPIGFMFDADITPFDFYQLFATMSTSDSSNIMKTWDFLLTAGFLFKVYEKKKLETSRIILRSYDLGYYTIHKYIDIANTWVRRTIHIRAGAMAEFNNNLDVTTFKQVYMVYAGVSWWSLHSMIFEILDDQVAEKYGKKHEVYGHSSFFVDAILDPITLEFGGRLGFHTTYGDKISSLYEGGYSPNKGLYLKMTFGGNFTFSNGSKRDIKNKKRNEKTYEM